MQEDALHLAHCAVAVADEEMPLGDRCPHGEEAVVGAALVGDHRQPSAVELAPACKQADVLHVAGAERAVVAAQQEDAVEVANGLGFLGDHGGETVEPLLGVDGTQRVAHLLDALADVASQLGHERQIEHGDEGDDGQREQDGEGTGEAHRRAL